MALVGHGRPGVGSSPMDRRCPLVSTGEGAHGSSMRPLYHPPSPNGQCTLRSYLMSTRVQNTQGAAHPTPWAVQRTRERSGPSFRRTHVTTRCCGTPCLRAASSNSINNLGFVVCQHIKGRSNEVIKTLVGCVPTHDAWPSTRSCNTHLASHLCAPSLSTAAMAAGGCIVWLSPQLVRLLSDLERIVFLSPEGKSRAGRQRVQPRRTRSCCACCKSFDGRTVVVGCCCCGCCCGCCVECCCNRCMKDVYNVKGKRHYSPLAALPMSSSSMLYNTSCKRAPNVSLLKFNTTCSRAALPILAATPASCVGCDDDAAMMMK